MNRLLSFLIVGMSCQLAFGQTTPELCQGAYFTEAQGKEFLEKHVPSSKKEWENRAAQIRNRIL